MDMHASINPKNVAPVSPIKVFAGLKLKGKNPKHAPANAAANIIRKSKQKFNFERLYKWAQTAPSKIKPHKI